MKEPASPVQDNADAPVEDNAAVPEGQDNVTGEQRKADSQTYLLNFKSKEDAEKAFKEEQRKITEQGTELSRLKAEMESLKGQAQLASAISDLAKAKGQVETKPVLDFNKFMDELAEEYQTDPKSAMRKQMTALNSWMSEEGEKARTEARKTAKEEMELAKAEFFDALERKDSTYDKYKDTIDKLVAGGMKLTAAKKFVKEELAKPDEDAGERSAPTPAVGNGRTPPPQKREGYFASANEREQYKKNYNLSEDEVRYLEAERARNIAIEADLQKRKEGV